MLPAQHQSSNAGGTSEDQKRKRSVTSSNALGDVTNKTARRGNSSVTAAASKRTGSTAAAATAATASATGARVRVTRSASAAAAAAAAAAKVEGVGAKKSATKKSTAGAKKPAVGNRQAKKKTAAATSQKSVKSRQQQPRDDVDDDATDDDDADVDDDDDDDDDDDLPGARLGDSQSQPPPKNQPPPTTNLNVARSAVGVGTMMKVNSVTPPRPNRKSSTETSSTTTATWPGGVANANSSSASAAATGPSSGQTIRPVWPHVASSTTYQQQQPQQHQPPYAGQPLQTVTAAAPAQQLLWNGPATAISGATTASSAYVGAAPYQQGYPHHQQQQQQQQQQHHQYHQLQAVASAAQQHQQQQLQQQMESAPFQDGPASSSLVLPTADDEHPDRCDAYWDIDAAGTGDPQHCAELAEDIYAILRADEVKFKPAADYMSRQPVIDQSMRGILTDWLVEVAEEYRLSSETLYLTMNYIDRYLSINQVMKSKLQLVGVACCLLAAKYEEIYPPSCDDFVHISDNAYTREEIFEMEVCVLQALDFRLTVPTIKVFLRRCLRAAMPRAFKASIMYRANMLANYICELTLLEYHCLKYKPSMIAAAAVCLSLHCCGLQPWDSTLEHYSRYYISNQRFRACVSDLHQLLANAPTNPLGAVREKYASKKSLRVSKWPVPAEPPQFNFVPAQPGTPSAAVVFGNATAAAAAAATASLDDASATVSTNGGAAATHQSTHH